MSVIKLPPRQVEAQQPQPQFTRSFRVRLREWVQGLPLAERRQGILFHEVAYEFGLSGSASRRFLCNLMEIERWTCMRVVEGDPTSPLLWYPPDCGAPERSMPWSQQHMKDKIDAMMFRDIEWFHY